MYNGYVRPPLQRTDKIVRSTQFYGETADWMTDFISARSKVAVDTTPAYFYHYQITRERKCSCATSEHGPEDLCPLCFGIGWLPGYSRIGYRTHILLDETEPNLQIVNCRPRYEAQYTPVPWTLDPGALEGSILTVLPVIPNLGVIDKVELVAEVGGPNVSEIDVLFETNDAWVPLESGTYDSFKTQPFVRIKVILSRLTVDTEAPLLYGVYLRYQLFTEVTEKADVPRWTTSEEFTDLGFIPILESFPMFFGADVTPLKQEDFFQHVETNRRFKITNIQPNMPMGKITSWDTNARRVQDDEPIADIP